MTGRPGDAVAVVTGAGRGLGEAMTGRFAEAGWSVLAVDRDDTALEQLVAGTAEHPGRVTACTLDLLDPDAPQRLVDAAVQAFGRLDVLVNNAGIAPLIGFLDTTRQQLRTMLEVNFEMQFLLTQAVVRRMIEQGQGGGIINIGTVHSEVGIRGGAAYAASKSALTAWTRTIAVELAPHGIRCNTVAPGPVATERVRRELTAEQIAQRAARVPVGRMGDASDIAGAVLFLAGPDGRFVNGQLLVVDGGLTISAAL
jgi:NAD(P)-dependent dehydrogenase (short-subunit alcohol dehydrogenase family)